MRLTLPVVPVSSDHESNVRVGDWIIILSSFQDICDELLTLEWFARPLEGAQDALTSLLRSSPTHLQ